MHYTQQQVLKILQLDQSTFVYWMRAHPRVARLKGRGCHFTRNDIVALGVLGIACRDLGCSIGAMGGFIDDLFQTLAGLPLIDLEAKAILIDASSVALRPLPIILEEPNSVAVVPLDPILDRIVSWDERDQYDLPLF